MFLRIYVVMMVAIAAIGCPASPEDPFIDDSGSDCQCSIGHGATVHVLTCETDLCLDGAMVRCTSQGNVVDLPFSCAAQNELMSWKSGNCTGRSTRISCVSDDPDCSLIPGCEQNCFFDGLFHHCVCVGTPEECDEQNYADSCGHLPGCSWSGPICETGFGDRCGTPTDEHDRDGFSFDCSAPGHHCDDEPVELSTGTFIYCDGAVCRGFQRPDQNDAVFDACRSYFEACTDTYTFSERTEICGVMASSQVPDAASAYRCLAESCGGDCALEPTTLIEDIDTITDEKCDLLFDEEFGDFVYTYSGWFTADVVSELEACADLPCEMIAPCAGAWLQGFWPTEIFETPAPFLED